MAAWLSDIGTAWKGLRASRASVLTAIATLALGTGAGTAVFAAAYGALLRPLPFRDAANLFVVTRTYPSADVTDATFSLQELTTWRTSLASTAELAGYTTEMMGMGGSSGPRSVRVGIVAGDLFALLGVRSMAGHLFDEHDAGDLVAVSRRFAVRLAGPDPAAAVGRDVVLAGRTRQVASVLPSSFDALAADIDIWVSARGIAPVTIFGGRDDRQYRALVRPVSGGPLDAARGAIDTRVFQPSGASSAEWRVNLHSLHEALVGDARPALIALVVASVLLLLVACANVATLLVNRAIAGAREMSVRLALGASQARLVRTAIAETASIAVVGAAAGWAVARVLVRFLDPLLPGSIAIADSPFASAAALVALAVTTLCGVAPVLAVRRRQPAAVLRERASTGSRTARRARDLLVVAQMAMAIVLLAATALLGRTVLTLLRTDIGLRATDRVLTLRLPISESARHDADARAAMIDDLLARVRVLPGVVVAGAGGGLPPASSPLAFTIRVMTGTVDRMQTFDLMPVTEGYLDALGATLTDGRMFIDGDRLAGRHVAVVSAAAARLLSPLGPVVDREVNVQFPSSTGTRVRPLVVGIVGDVRYSGLDANGRGNVYIPWRQLPLGTAFLAVRTSGDPRAIAPSILRLVHDVEPTLPIDEPRTLGDEVQRTLTPRTTRFVIVGLFAVSALALAVVGLVGALVRSVIERHRELAIRAALGATPARMARLVVVHGLGVAGAGVVLGTGASLAAGRAIASLIVGVSPYDPAVYAAIVAMTIVLAAAASALAARRAAAVDPVELMRAE